MRRQKKAADTAETFLKTEEVAKRLNLCPNAVRGMAARGELPQYVFGRSLRFRWSEIIEIGRQNSTAKKHHAS